MVREKDQKKSKAPAKRSEENEEESREETFHEAADKSYPEELNREGQYREDNHEGTYREGIEREGTFREEADRLRPAERIQEKQSQSLEPTTGSNTTAEMAGNDTNDIGAADGPQGSQSSEGSRTSSGSLPEQAESFVRHTFSHHRDKLKVEIFDGKKGQDLERWIKDYKLRSKNAGWDDNAIRESIPMYLGGKYRHWYEGKFVYGPDEKVRLYDTSEKIFKTMLDAELTDKENWLKQLKDLKQGDGPLNRYLQDIERICNELNPRMDEEQKVEYAYEGMNKELGRRIFEKRPKTLDEMQAAGKEVEAGFKKFQEDESEQMKKLKEELQQIKEKVD